MKTPSPRLYAVLTLGFGTTVAMWAVGYFGRLPAVTLPSPLLLGALLLCMLGGGWLTARQPGLGLGSAAAVGGIAGLLNLLVLGSFLSGDAPGSLLPVATVWVSGFLGASALLALVGALAAGRSSRGAAIAEPTRWVGRFALVAVGATLLVLAAGGLVTSAEAGLAVVDWPNSFGYNMFLYPFARMTGGIYYEHAHRLFGALVGLTVLTLAILMQRAEPRRSLRTLGWVAFVMITLQGLMGGLRVTGKLTLTTDAAEVAPNLGLALVHGVFAQICFAVLVTIAVLTSRSWATASGAAHVSARTARWLGPIVLVALGMQLVLGAAQRHFSGWLMEHLGIGILVVTPLVVFLAARAWTIDLPAAGVLRRSGLALLIALPLQVCLGLAAYLATGATEQAGVAGVWDLTFATAHQWVGALILALTVTIVCWNRRLLAIPGVAHPAGAVDRLQVS